MEINNKYNSIIEKRKLSILKKRAAKLQRLIENKEKEILKAGFNYSNDEKKLNKISDEKQDITQKIKNIIGFKSENVSIKELPFTERGKKLKTLQFSVKQNGIKRSTIKNIANNIQNLYVNKIKMKARIQIVLLYDSGFKTKGFQDIHDDIELFNLIQYQTVKDKHFGNYKIPIKEQDVFNHFTITIQDYAVGTDNKFNDCLYNCLYDALGDNLEFTSPNSFKKWLKLDRDELININLLPLIEKKIKTKLIINGDIKYNSSFDSYKHINIEFKNFHATLIKPKHSIKKLVHFRSKQPLIYNKINHHVFDGEKEYFLTKEQRNEIYNKEGEYILVPKSHDNSTMKEEYDKFILNADILLKQSKGEINLYKCGSDVIAALNLFYKYNMYTYTEKILNDEAETILNASKGAIMFAIDNTKLDIAYEYDIISLYPSIMNSDTRFPLRRGEYKTITTNELPEFFQYGLYNCILTPKFNTHRGLYKLNKNNWYTHFDLQRAKELGFKIEMIENKDNFLYYSRDKLVTGKQIFGKYVHLLFDLKKRGISKAKPILNILWGALIEQTSNKKLVSNDIEVKISKNKTIQSMIPYNEDYNIVKCSNTTNIFKYNYARIKPFLLSKARCKMSKIIEPIVYNIVRFHTDGFITSKQITDEVELGDDIGCLSYRGCYNKLNIKNINDIECDKFDKA